MVEKKIYDKLPKGWREIEDAQTAPVGYVWICNNKSHFSGERICALMKEKKKE